MSAPHVIVTGVVRDSLARRPLPSAWVQMVDANSAQRFTRTTNADSLGRFAFADVPDGRYKIGFFHPLLDSLGIEPAPRELAVRRQRSVQIELGTPSAAQMRHAICGASSGAAGAGSGGLLIGTVRDARSLAPVADASVVGEWMDFSIGAGRIGRQRPRLEVTSDKNGWFALCNVPNRGTMFLGASMRDRNTDFIEIRVPPDGFVRRELFVGTAVVDALRDSSASGDTTAPVTWARQRHGDGRLSGSVLTVEGQLPLAGSSVRITDGPMARANSRGEWTIENAPDGTRTLEVRAMGYYAERRAVDVVPGGPPVRVSLSTFQHVLDTVKVLTSPAASPFASGFEQRMRTGMGRYITPKDLLRRGVIEVGDVFKNLPGVQFERASTGVKYVTMRNAFNDQCTPWVFVDGLFLWDLSIDDINSMVSANTVKGIEVYSDTNVPAEFRRPIMLPKKPEDPPRGCGTIVIWRK